MSESPSQVLGKAAAPAADHPVIESVLYSPLRRDGWAEDLPSTDHIEFFRSRDWSASHLGPIQQWPTALRLHIHTLFSDSRPSVIFWGPERVAIYNEAFVPLAGKAHPYLMGRTSNQGFPETWNHIKGVFINGETNGVAVDVNELEIYVERSGYIEEAYFTGNFNPLRGNSGNVEGFYHAVHEVTKEVLSARRVRMMNLAAHSADEHESYGPHIIAALETSPRDVPMALLYELDEETKPGQSVVRLVGNIGVPKGHKLAVTETLLSSEDGLVPLLRTAQTEIVTSAVGEDFDGIEWQGFNEPSRSVHILPLWSGKQLFGHLVLGLNPRQEADNNYFQYLRDLSRQLSATIASFVGVEKARRREERLERELADSERKIRYMAKHASVGMQHLTPEGDMVWGNDQYYKLTGQPRPEQAQDRMSFLDVILDEDKHIGLAGFKRVLEGAPQVEMELRLKKMFTPPFGDPEPVFILVLAFPYREEGEIKTIMACVTDVSRLKWAETWHARKAEDARLAKRRQEEFVDIISHEIRNPLSAIFQCADMISTSQNRLLAGAETGNSALCIEVLKGNVDDANTIIMCAKHQKRIVDDILTMSKLDFTGLSITATGVQVSQLVEGVVKMFEVELASHHIESQLIADESLAANHVDWILCDPSRVTQILVNLLTNAIKFTRAEETRRITMKFGATTGDPRTAFGKKIYWAPSHDTTDDLTLTWDPEDQFYLTFSIKDTAGGMTAEEIQRLFSRFEQGNSRTFIKYGGSGLGLYISRKLTAKHGGDIGVASQPGKGSTFVFYVKARRTEHVKRNAPVPLLKSAYSTNSVVNENTPPVNTSPLPIREVNHQRQPIVLSQTHILLVEDNIVNQQVLRKQLMSAGCIVSVANHGMEALEFIRKTPYWHSTVPSPAPLDLVLMDVEMPVMNGLKCTSETRRLEASGEITKHIEIIGITANARPEQIDLALRSGMDAVITKPFMTSDLLAKIREHLSEAAAQEAG